jgi:SAM-dependent methyltransferase
MDDHIYARPRDYDLEHEHDDEDVAFHLELVRRVKPARVLELGAGSGRVTVPLAELAFAGGFTVTALDSERAMLTECERKLAGAAPEVRGRVDVVVGDMRSWEAPEPFDLILIPCASVSHLLELDDQLATWRRAHANLAPGGRFVVDVVMPDLGTYADSLRQPPRALVEIDGDSSDGEGRRLLRYRTTMYAPHEQRATVRFLYDKFAHGEHPERWLSDFESHVYFPRELELLFRHAGFSVEARYGDYRFRAPRASTRTLVMIGRKCPDPTADRGGVQKGRSSARERQPAGAFTGLQRPGAPSGMATA